MAIATGTAIAGAAIGGALLSHESGRKQARAAGSAARAQEAEAGRQFNISREDRMAREERALDLSAASPEEIQNLELSLAAQERNINKQSRLFDALDPAVMAASEQALQLLQGREAKALSPLRRNREQGRTRLLNRLREQLGPGAETSSAGIQALNQFDMQTDQVLSGAQQQSLSQLFGIGSQGASQRTALGDSVGRFRQIGQGFGDIAQRQTSAFLGASDSSAQSQAGQTLVGSAGSQFAGAQLRAQNEQALFGQVLNAGTTLAAANMGAQQPVKP